MIRRVLAALALSCALVALLPAGAAAQIVRNFTPRFSTNDNGDITMIGNTIMSCSGGGGCNGARNGTGGNLNNNDFTMQYVNADTDGSTFSSSSATLALPAGATVLWAGLHWMGDSNNGSRNQVRLATPAAGYATVTATQLDANGGVYHGYVDVTARVQAGGSGVYWVANVQSTTGSNRFAGWGLVVVYRLASDPPRNLVVFDGYALVSGTTTVTMPVSGFVTPPAGATSVATASVSTAVSVTPAAGATAAATASVTATVSVTAAPASTVAVSVVAAAASTGAASVGAAGAGAAAAASASAAAFASAAAPASSSATMAACPWCR